MTTAAEWPEGAAINGLLQHLTILKGRLPAFFPEVTGPATLIITSLCDSFLACAEQPHEIRDRHCLQAAAV